MGHFSYLGDATVGAEANIGAGTITCNYDGKQKNPTVVGAGAFIGSDTMLVAPVVVGDGAKTGAGAVVTREDVRHMKPHPMPVQAAAQELGVPAEQCIMVGDTVVDVRAGKAAGALAVGVRSGFGQDGDFNEADLVLDSPAQLVLWL